MGTASGNDPTVQIELTLCGSGDVTGQLQWSSLVSGWNRREVSGSHAGTTVVLSDDAIVDERAEPGWRFCPIDRYELTVVETGLEGTYRSEACDDSAELHLTDVGTSEVRPASPAPEPTSLPTGCVGCSTVPTVSVGAVLLVVLWTRQVRGATSTVSW